MNIRKIVAVSLVFLMTIGILPEGLLANDQNPIQEIEKVTVSHQVTNVVGQELSIAPKIQVDWIAPLDNAMPINRTENDQEKASHYDFSFTNLNDASNTQTEQILASKFGNAPVLSMNAQDYFKNFFKNGALYKLQITAKHKHKVVVDNKTTYVDSNLSSFYPNPTKYFLTDFNLQANASEGLTFSWEYVPGMSYYLYYEKGNKQSISEMTGAGKEITAEEAKNNLNEDGTRVVYTVEKAVPGQIYSAYILPIGLESTEVKFNEIDFNSTTPKLIHVTPNIPLTVEPLGSSKVRLSWDITQAAWVSVGNKLYQTVIYQIDSKGEKTELGRIYNDNKGNQDVGYFECARPTEAVTYVVDFILKNSSGNLEVGFSAGPKKYVPDELREVPYQPYIPEVFNYKASDSVSSEDITTQDKYKVKFNGSYNDLVLDINNIMDFKKSTFHYEIEDKKANVQIVWDAPQKGTTGTVDYDLYYDIWVSQKADKFEDKDKVVSNLKIQESDTDHLIYRMNGNTVVGMKTVLKELEPNRTYYIKMVAKRKYGENDYAVSLPTIKQISIDKVGDVYEPPAIGKPPLQLKEVTKESVTIMWAEKWYEILASQNQVSKYSGTEQILAQWGHSRVYLSGEADTPIRFRDEEKKYGDPIDLYGSTVQNKIQKIQSILNTGNYILKAVSMGSDTYYKMKVVKQKEVDEQRGNKSLEEWVASIDQSEVKNLWEDVTEQLEETTVEGVAGKSLKITKDYKGNDLTANTPYVVLISACRLIDGEWEYSIIPSYLLATTATDHVSDLETPKTPRLYNYESKDVRDTEVTVRWIYNANFDYELVYSRLDNPDEATVWEFTEDDKKTFVDGSEAIVTISGLLPETTYNFWIRAKQKAELVPEGGEPKQSDWSTPVTCTTLTLANPLPPSGLGLASEQSIQEAGKDFKPKGEDYLTVEWMRNASDLNNKDKRLTYSYIVEIADNPRFLDATSVTVGDTEGNNNQDNNGEDKEDEEAIKSEIITKSMVKFSGLRANAPYYIKVKTVLTFVDGDKTITKESEFTDYIRLFTNKSSSEYDGGENPNIVEYEKPIEESYKNDIWTYELVDAAKITTQIVNDKAYYYTITMENYKNKYDAVTRRVKMPVKILQTLSNQGMSLQVVTNIAAYEIPADALKNYLIQYEGTDTIQLDFTRKSYSDISTYVRSYPETYVSGEQLNITFRGNNKNTKVNTLNANMKVKLKVEAAGAYNYANYFTYLYNYNKGEWEAKAYQVDNSDNKYLTYPTMNTGLNALYLRTVANGNMDSSYLMNALTSTYNITGLGTVYEQTDTVKAAQYVSLMLGIARNSKAIDLTQGASAADYSAAKASGIYISNARGTVTKEQALAGVVKLYEIKHGDKIKASNMSFSKVSSNYKQAVSKAYAVGLIETMNDPQSGVTYGELCDWIAIAVD